MRTMTCKEQLEQLLDAVDDVLYISDKRGYTGKEINVDHLPALVEIFLKLTENRLGTHGSV